MCVPFLVHCISWDLWSNIFRRVIKLRSDFVTMLAQAPTQLIPLHWELGVGVSLSRPSFEMVMKPDRGLHRSRFLGLAPPPSVRPSVLATVRPAYPSISALEIKSGSGIGAVFASRQASKTTAFGGRCSQNTFLEPACNHLPASRLR